MIYNELLAETNGQSYSSVLRPIYIAAGVAYNGAKRAIYDHQLNDESL